MSIIDDDRITKAIAAALRAKARLGARGARGRLSEMITQEVSMVDRAANLRDFVVTKSLDGGSIPPISVRVVSVR